MSEEKSLTECVQELLGEFGIERSVDELSVAFDKAERTCESDKLRAALDERGVKYTCKDREEDIYNDRQMETSWSDGRFDYLLIEFFRGENPVTTQFSMGCEYGMTAEQAIAATVGGYTYDQWRAISNAVADAMEYAHDVAIRHPDKADPYWDLDNYVNRILDVAFEGKREKLSCASCPEMGNPDSYIRHLSAALEYERGVEQASSIYKEVIREYVVENDKLRKLVCMMLRVAGVAEYATDAEWQTVTHYLSELGIEVSE